MSKHHYGETEGDTVIGSREDLGRDRESVGRGVGLARGPTLSLAIDKHERRLG